MRDASGRTEMLLGVSLRRETWRTGLGLQSLTGPSAAGLRLSRDTICLTSQAQTKHKVRAHKGEAVGAAGRGVGQRGHSTRREVATWLCSQPAPREL